ncbi:MAG: tRNA (guanosine(37)-N1)-methyltransferase TrmD [Bacilli bacterium]|jgi:tRNA (guanine37-N1)-methyltransferase
MIIDVITIFPEIIKSAINQSIIARALVNNYVEINVLDFREFSLDKNKRVDDYSYGGGAGMVIGVQPIVAALKSIKDYQSAHKILTSPEGVKYNQKKAHELKSKKHLIIICGHYEGIDARINNYIDETISLGDFILTGGEIAALAIIDSVVRLIDGVLGNSQSLETESFEMGLLEYDQYTRPEEFDGYSVPEVLLSGNHEKIRQFRRYNAIEKTYKKRPDLLEEVSLSKEDEKILKEIKNKE